MADLSSQANRLNDVEINNNKPVSSGVFRRIGSNINYLLDYLGVSNGATTAGPSSGVNVFTPAQAISYSLTLNGSTPIGTPQTLFTFTGGGDRPLMFFRRTSGFRVAERKFFGNVITDLYANSLGYGLDVFPVLYILRNSIGDISDSNISMTTYPAQIVSRVFVNGIEAGRVTRNSSGGSLFGLAYNFDIAHAPTGTNTVTVTLDQFRGPSNTLSYSGHYVAL